MPDGLIRLRFVYAHEVSLPNRSTWSGELSLTSCHFPILMLALYRGDWC